MQSMKAFAVDDEQLNLKIVEAMAREIDLEIESYVSPLKLLERLSQGDAETDLFFIDYKMPEMDGIALTEKIRSTHPDIPMVMITSVSDDDTLKIRAIESGATEFLNKPLNIAEFKARVHNLLALRRSAVLLKDRAKLLEDEVRRATSDIALREQETLNILGRVADFKDMETGAHIQRVAHYARLIAKLIGQSVESQDIIFNAAPLHDIGKIGIPDIVLAKPGKLGMEEITQMQRHPLIGYEILKNAESPYLKAGALISLTHHERWDGTGYPNGLKGEQIHIYGRIVAVSDVFDALCSNRPYKAAWPPNEVVRYVEEERGRHFDPMIAGIFLDHIAKFEDIYRLFRD